MQIERLNPDTLFSTPIFSQAVAISDAKLIVTAGQVAWDKDGQLVGAGDFRQQTIQCAKNIDHILTSVHATWANVIKLTVYIAQYDEDKHLAILGDVLRTFSNSEHLPANTLLGVQSLARAELLIEIEAIIAIEKV